MLNTLVRQMRNFDSVVCRYMTFGYKYVCLYGWMTGCLDGWIVWFRLLAFSGQMHWRILCWNNVDLWFEMNEQMTGIQCTMCFRLSLFSLFFFFFVSFLVMQWVNHYLHECRTTIHVWQHCTPTQSYNHHLILYNMSTALYRPAYFFYSFLLSVLPIFLKSKVCLFICLLDV